MKRLLLLILFLPTFVFAEKGHIADDAQVYVHSGPSNAYRIISRISSGSPVEILNRDTKTRYVQIRMSNGKTGWVEGGSVDPGDSLSERLPKLESALSKSKVTAASQASQIETLLEESGQIKQQNEELTGQVDELKTSIKELEFQISTMDESNLMRWFTHGGLVALGGVLLGLLMPYFPRRKKKNDDWF